MGRCSFKRCSGLCLRQSYLELATSTLWLADMQTRGHETHGLFFTPPDNFFTFDLSWVNLHIT